MPMQPLGEVFGYPIHNHSDEARRYQSERLCPFNNKVPECTKVSLSDPLGVCSILHGNDTVVTCPVRFRQGWRIADDAAAFFFPSEARTTRLTEVRIKDEAGESAGNIDVVIVCLDEQGAIIDFGSLEVQAVYISGNVRRPFRHFMDSQNPAMDWSAELHYPRPDYLSSSRKRLAPQIYYKGSIIKGWGKKQAIALQKSFYETLAPLDRVGQEKADMAWLIYDLQYDKVRHVYDLVLVDIVYSLFDEALERISIPRAGPIEPFMHTLQAKLAATVRRRSLGGQPEASPIVDV